MKTSSHKGKEGGALLMVMLMFLVLMVLSIGMFKLLEFHGIGTVRAQGRVQAFWLAEAGLAEFRAQVDPWQNRAPLANLGLLGTGVVTGRLAGVGAYRVDVSDYTANGWNNAGSATKQYWIRSTGILPGGTTETVEIRTRIGTLADYIYATHDEGSIQFHSGDVIEGRVHSNDRFKINGTPKFKGRVTSAADWVQYTDSRENTYIDPNVFTAGLGLGVSELNFGQFGTDPIENLQAGASLGLSGDYDIEFQDDQYLYRPHYVDNGGNTPDPWVTNSINARDVIYVTGNAYVEGRVGNTISVASEEAVHITGDIVYASSPNNDYSAWPSSYTPDPDELLGLLSKEAVQVDSQVSGTGAEPDINIHAAIYITKANGAVGTGNPGFGTEDRFKSVGGPSINLIGSITQYSRGVVGQTNGNGYKKNYSYDSRFIDTPPPGIPYSAYEFSEWRLP